ncbi:MAG: hypothetical protein GY733_03370 [bacterium]|nr:hypothetical protein [bacterium]
MATLAVAPLALTAVPHEGPRIELPDSRAAKVWAAVGADTEPAPEPKGLADLLAPGAWEKPATWRRWAALVAAEGKGDAPDPARRAELCLLAAGQKRAGDAWKHYEQLGASPAWAARTLPYLVPGVPPGTTIGPGGSINGLASGALLRPLTPPTSEGVPARALQWRTASVPKLAIGDAFVDFSIAVESSGVQVDVTHVEGEPVKIGVLLPEPPGWDVRVEYLDWMRQETLHEPLLFDVVPDEERHSLFGRILEARAVVPRALPKRLPAQLLQGGLELVLAPNDHEQALYAVVAEELAKLLSIEVRVRTEGEALAGWTGTRYRMASGSQRRMKASALVSSVEEFVMAQPSQANDDGTKLRDR